MIYYPCPITSSSTNVTFSFTCSSPTDANSHRTYYLTGRAANASSSSSSKNSPTSTAYWSGGGSSTRDYQDDWAADGGGEHEFDFSRDHQRGSKGRSESMGSSGSESRGTLLLMR